MAGDAEAREKLIANETVKLFATTLNNVAVAFLVAGVVAPLVGLGVSRYSADQLALSLIWLMTGVTLHYCARLALRGLRP